MEEAEAIWEQTRNSGAVKESVDQMTTSQQTEAAKTREVMNSAQAASEATVEAMNGIADRVGIEIGDKMDGMGVYLDQTKVGQLVSNSQADNARSHLYDGGEP